MPPLPLTEHCMARLLLLRVVHHQVDTWKSNYRLFTNGALLDCRAAGCGMPSRGLDDSRYHAETALDAILDDLQV